MNIPIRKWKPLNGSFSKDLNEALQQQHHAAQFIALAGHHLIEQLPDDSNTNMEYIPVWEMLLGHILPQNIRIGLHLTGLSISIFDKTNVEQKVILLQDKTKQTVFNELKQELEALG